MGNWDVSKQNKDGEPCAELATKTCNKQIVSKLEDAELARDSEETCNNKQVTSKLVASEDAISRQAAIDALKNLEDLQGRNVFTKNGLYPWNVIAQLPSVTPMQRTGHWIHRKMDNECWEECSECHVERAYPTLYCPDCGCHMIEP